jgi:hypothetical protein
MYTLTPPGADQPPWDRSKCGHGEGVACGGKRGCVIDAEARRSWNDSFQRRLSRLYETAQAATKREVGCRANILAIGKEAQRRGATHAHLVVGCETGLELRASRAFRRHLERLSGQSRYEFGHVNGKFVKPRPPREVAAYLSSYFVAGREARTSDRSGAERRAPVSPALRLEAAHAGNGDNDAEQAPATASVGQHLEGGNEANLVEGQTHADRCHRLGGAGC